MRGASGRTICAQPSSIRRAVACPQNFLSLVPLALLLGEVTEDLAVRFGDTVGGLLNATFGNVVELILSIAALQKGLYDVVATSLVGSVLSNLLLVLGAPLAGHRLQAQDTLAGCCTSVHLCIGLACTRAVDPPAAEPSSSCLDVL